MPETFFSFVWPLVFILVILAGLIVCIAALATMSMAIARARHYHQMKGVRKDEHADEVDPISQAYQGGSQRLIPVETMTTDGIHYTPML